MKGKRKEEANEIARERVDRLFEMAEKAAAEGDLESADRYVEMAWKIKLKFRIKLAKSQKKLFCRKCLKFLVDGKTARLKRERGNLIIECLNCQAVRRVPLGAEEPD